jgi:hypothetical protein
MACEQGRAYLRPGGTQPGRRPGRGGRRTCRQNRGEDLDPPARHQMGSAHLDAGWEPKLDRTRQALRSKPLRIPFVHVGDGRRWFIPTAALDCESTLTLGGPKYSEFEIESGRPLAVRSSEAVLQSGRSPGEYRSGQTGCAVNAVALSFGGSNPPSPISSPRPVEPTNYERKPGQNGEAVINQKRRITVPQRPFFEAGFANGGRVRVRADGPGRIVVEQIQLPDWALADQDPPTEPD